MNEKSPSLSAVHAVWTEGERLLEMADAFARSSQTLTATIEADPEYYEHADWIVAMHLCRHAAELYFKGALAIRNGSVTRGSHNVRALRERYVESYPESFFHFELPFPQTLERENDLFPWTFADFDVTLDQRFRYPADRLGQPFVELAAVEIAELSKSVQRFATSISVLRTFIIRQWEPPR